MKFPPLKYTLPSFPDITIIYQVSMADRPDLIRFAESISKANDTDIESVLKKESELVRLVSNSLRAVDFGGEIEYLSELPESRFQWVMDNFIPKALQESYTAILSNKIDESYEKK